MDCNGSDREWCNYDKMGCRGCAHHDVLDNVKLIKDLMKEDNYSNRDIDSYLDELETKLKESIISSNYYKKMYAETNNIFVHR